MELVGPLNFVFGENQNIIKKDLKSLNLENQARYFFDFLNVFKKSLSLIYSVFENTE